MSEKIDSKQRTDKPLSTVTATLLANASANPEGIPDRGITPATVKRFGVVVQGERHIYPYFLPDDKLTPAAAKKRLGSGAKKAFPSEGPMKETMLFGQQVFNGGGRNIVITEGETDAMAAFQLQGSKYPAVSVRSSGDALKDCKRNFEWLDSFENVLICMDNDEAGQKAAGKLAELFSGKAKVMNLGKYNDPVEMLRDGAKGKDAWKTAFFGAETYTPPGIISGDSLWDDLSKPLEKSPLTYPWDGLNDITYGIRFAELVTLTAGSGVGKSQVLREILYHILCTSEENMGLMFMEENARKTGLSLMSLAANSPLHLPGNEVDDELKRTAFEQTTGSGRVFMSNSDHFGNATLEGVMARIRYFRKAFDCRVIAIDHLGMFTSGKGGSDTSAIDEAMTSLRTLCQELEIVLFLISHLKRPDGKGHEEGAQISLAQLRGSGATAHLSDLVIGAERNGQADDAVEANRTRLRIIKNRFSGELGLATALDYDKATGRLTEADDDYTTTSSEALEEAL